MLLIYSQKKTPRLQYICSFIFNELLGIDFSITQNKNEAINFSGAFINYSSEIFSKKQFNIIPASFLFEADIAQQPVSCFETNQYKAFFKTENADFDFDIFAASFYLLSRYEEYLPHEKDIYGRYAHENSLAFKEDFLKYPLINIWLHDFAARLNNKFPSLKYRCPSFQFIPTYDIDIAFSYKGKGLVRNAGGILKSLSQFHLTEVKERIEVLLGLKKDPFDTFSWLDTLHQQFHLNPLYFFLAAKKNGIYDKQVLPQHRSMQRLIKKIAGKYSIGIHPSWQSGDDFSLFRKEVDCLEKISGKKITLCRRHYLRFNLPGDYQKLIEAGMFTDYSMAYGSINGFRASVANPFYWYDLEKEEITKLRVHPFCYMEANSIYEQKNTADEALNEMLHYAKVCKQVGGVFYTLFHNNILAEIPSFSGWRKMYAVFLKKLFK